MVVVFNDVDFCLRVKEIGVWNVYCVEVELYYYELVSRGLDYVFEKVVRFNREFSYFKVKWGSYIEYDFVYSLNFIFKCENFFVKEKDELVFWWSYIIYILYWKVLENGINYE